MVDSPRLALPPVGGMAVIISGGGDTLRMVVSSGSVSTARGRNRFLVDT